MSDTWTGDACSLVDAFRAGDRSPLEELDAIARGHRRQRPQLLLVPRSRPGAGRSGGRRPLQAVRRCADRREGARVRRWAGLRPRRRWSSRTASPPTPRTVVERLFDIGGAVPVGLTTASEFGGLNVSVTKLNGVTHNPWRHGRTVGGSSGGSAAAVAGGLVSLATGGDGGGSIRIPAGYTGLLGMKGTFGRIPRSPNAYMRPNTVVLGNLARSVRDAARYFDVCGGYHGADPSSLPKHPGFEAGLGSHDLRGQAGRHRPRPRRRHARARGRGTHPGRGRRARPREPA